MSEDLVTLIKRSAQKMEEERRAIQEDIGWIVQYCPCGHVVEITKNNPLVERCKQNKYLDALIQPSHACPICRPNIFDGHLFVKEIK